MTATVEPDAGSRQLQQFLWTLGEVRLRRFDGEEVPGGDPDTGDVAGPPPEAEYQDFFTEWQPSGPT